MRSPVASSATPAASGAVAVVYGVTLAAQRVASWRCSAAVPTVELNSGGAAAAVASTAAAPATASSTAG